MTDLRDEVAVLVHLLRAAGLEVGTHQAIALVAGVSELGPRMELADFYWAGRATLVVHQEHLATYERVFTVWLAGHAPVKDGAEALGAAPPASEPDQQKTSPEERSVAKEDRSRPPGEPAGGVGTGSEKPADQEVGQHVDEPGPGTSGDEERGELTGAIASVVEALRRRRFSEATDDELRAIQELMGHIVVAVPQRRSRRTRAARRGPITDLRGSVRGAIQTDGELLRLPRRRRTVRPRRLVLVLDVSGSMAGYSRALLHFAYTARVDTRDVEVFCFGTRLTRLTDLLSGRDVDRALAAAADRVMDWDGGTLIGRSLATLNRSYGRCGRLRGAVVVICSDGLERGDPSQVGEEVARVARYAYRVVWVNPLKGDSRYQPQARGMAAALPHLDRFVSGHNLASLDELAAVLRGL